MIILSRLALLIQEEPVEGEIYFEHREMFKILSHAIYWQYLFNKVFSGDDFGAFDYPSLIAIFGVNLPDPAGILDWLYL
jgi:hypothetical protein